MLSDIIATRAIDQFVLGSAVLRLIPVAKWVIASSIAMAAWHRRRPVQLALVVLLAGGIAVDFLLAPRPA